ncbi:MAG: LamG domain-containing protein, partial [Bacteroidota bacterium]
MSKKLHLKLDTIVDNQVLDISGYGYNGTVADGVSVVEDDKFGSCLEFDGNYSAISFWNSLVEEISGNSFTVCAWVNLSTLTGTQCILGDASRGIQNQGLHLTCKNGRPHMGFWLTGTVADTAITANEWHYLTWMYDKDAREQRMYLNGSNIVTGTDKDAYVGSTTLRLGNHSNTSRFSGKMSSVRIYDTVL